MKGETGPADPAALRKLTKLPAANRDADDEATDSSAPSSECRWFKASLVVEAAENNKGCQCFPLIRLTRLKKTIKGNTPNEN